MRERKRWYTLVFGGGKVSEFSDNRREPRRLAQPTTVTAFEVGVTSIIEDDCITKFPISAMIKLRRAKGEAEVALREEADWSNSDVMNSQDERLRMHVPCIVIEEFADERMRAADAPKDTLPLTTARLSPFNNKEAPGEISRLPPI